MSSSRKSKRSQHQRRSWDHGDSHHLTADPTSIAGASSSTVHGCQRSHSIASQQPRDPTSGLLVPTDVDAAISAIARASLHNLAFSVDLLRPFVDEAGAGGNRKLSDSDIYARRHSSQSRCSRSSSSVTIPQPAANQSVLSSRRSSSISSSNTGATIETSDIDRTMTPPPSAPDREPTLIRIIEAEEDDQQSSSVENSRQVSSAITIEHPVHRRNRDRLSVCTGTGTDDDDDDEQEEMVQFKLGSSGSPIVAPATTTLMIDRWNTTKTIDDASSDDEPIDAGRRHRRTRSDALFRRPSWPVTSTDHRQSHRKSVIDLGMAPTRKCGVDMDHYASTEQLVVDMIDDHDRELFVQLDELYLSCTASAESMEWRETGRWIKYEEAVETGAERFGKPKVSSLSFHGLLELRHCIEIGTVILDLRASTKDIAMERIVDQMCIMGQVSVDDQAHLHRLLLLHHRHVDDANQSAIRRQACVYSSLFRYFHTNRNTQQPFDDECPSRQPPPINGHLQLGASLSVDDGSGANAGMHPKNSTGKRPTNDAYYYDGELMKRLSRCAEAGSILVGSTAHMRKPSIAFVRLRQSIMMLNQVQIPVPIRFLFVLLGPLSPGLDYHEVGRSMATLLANKRFRDIAYSATHRIDLIRAINEFFDDSIVLPPGDWDRDRLLDYDHIRSKSHKIRQRRRALTRPPPGLESLLRDQEERRLEDPLRRTNCWFGGLRREARRRFRYYASDFSDALNWQCFKCVVFIFLTCFFPALTFGAILSEATDGWIGVTETLLATSIGGVAFALASTQPLLVLGVCGPMLIFEESLYIFCSVNDFTGAQYLGVRCWVSIWSLLLCVITVAWEAPLLIRFVTRFSDDILSALISVIFLTECGRFVRTMFVIHPVMSIDHYCNNNANNSNDTNSTIINSASAGAFAQTNYRHHADDPQPNTALLSCILIAATFLIAFVLRSVRNSRYFGRQVRKTVGDFGLSLSVIIVVLIDRWLLEQDSLTSKLRISADFLPTLADRRDWFVAPIVHHSSWWVPIGAVLPGILLFLILFTETEVCEMILAGKENCLRKGTGYHWDLLLSGTLLVACSLFGAPWLCAASVRSTAHVHSLTKYRLRAPGQKPRITGVVEQRCTALVLHMLIGATLLAVDVLKAIPVAVLFGVFLYLGVMNMCNAQMLHRSILFFVPVKYHPSNAVYCLRVRTWRMHLFTGIQLICFAFVWTIKSIKTTAFAFPFAILLAVIVRHYAIPLLFTNMELLALDGADDDQDEDIDFYQESRMPAYASAMQLNKGSRTHHR